MRRTLLKWFALAFLIAVSSGVAYSQRPECSTEIVNPSCTLTIDRSYPVALPTIQVRPGATVIVQVKNGLPFESLSLDLQSSQAVAATDQTAGFVTAALPYLKGLLAQQQTMATPLTKASAVPVKNPLADEIRQDEAAIPGNYEQVQNYFTAAATVYSQLNEVLGPLPPQVLPQGSRLSDSPVQAMAPNTPRPWVAAEFPKWIAWLLCEIGGGQSCSSSDMPPAKPSVQGLMGAGTSLATQFGPCPSDGVKSATSPILACRLAFYPDAVKKGGFPPEEEKSLLAIVEKLSVEVAALNAQAAAVTAIDKDLGTYFTNISQAVVRCDCNPLGTIQDPRDENWKPPRNLGLKRFLGRQVTFAVNSINEIGNPATSVQTAAQKKAVVNITVVFGDPIFEVSTGALFSGLANRSFANQTDVTQNPGASPTPGNVVISQTIARPTVILFAAGNWRLGHDFLLRDRRAAFYFTVPVVGVNVNNNAAEFGLGPSFSWRSIMFSALYDWGHDIRLTQGEFVGEVWCNQSTATSTIPKCSGSPPSPSTEKYWRGAVAFGVSVRVPSIFGGGSH